MTIDLPKPGQIPQLRQLWQEAFGDSDAFLDSFFSLSFAPERCRCVTEENHVTAALYWFDCSCHGGKMAYLYAVATGKEVIEATVIKADGTTAPLTLNLMGLTPDEKEIILEGCLMNYYAAHME